MATRDALLTFLETHRGTFFSGEALAGQLSVSRTAVWKAVQALRRSGYPIDAAPNRGYRLAAETDILSAPGVQKELTAPCAGLQLELADSLPSTNSRARELAAAGAPEGTVVLARRQTGGRGRQGRRFFSPADTGLYLSLLLRPAGWTAAQAAALTTMAAVDACEAIEAVCGVAVSIKWVNDLFAHGRKVGGILTEAALSLENGLVESVVLGVGVNLLPPAGGFPPDLADIAGAVADRPQSDVKNRLAAGFLNRFMADYAAPQAAALHERYRSRCFVLGRPVQVVTPRGSRPATALDIDGSYRLLVEYDNGERERLFSGEIRVQCPAASPAQFPAAPKEAPR